MNNFLVATAVFLIAVLAAAFAIPRVVHWESYRGVIEEEATRLLGRDVRVGGGVRIRLLPSPIFSIEKIRIADTEANTGEPFFQAEALRGRLAIAPLLRGVLQASEIVLEKPLLHLVLDGKGGGNWKSLASGAGQLPFQFSEVALDSLKIVDGKLAIFGTDRAERLRVDAIDGMLSAQALDGPFRFRGTFGAEPQRREFRLSTTRQEADGSIRFKAALTHNDTGASYNFDARAVDLSRAPRVEGELSAKVALPALTGPQATPVQTPRKAEQEAPVELKAALSADLKLVKLANLSLAFERNGRPQILTGDAAIDLGNAVTLDARLAAKWLDLDQIIGASPTPGADTKPERGPVQGLLTLAQRLNGFALEQGQTRLALDVEQANLGREAVSGLRLSLQGNGAETDIRELRLGLPGGAQADIKGLMAGYGEETSFSGDIVLRGASLARFLAWSTAGATTLDPARDGTFAMRARLDAAPGSVIAREFTGELAGTLMQGELGYRWQGRPEVSVLIEGPRVDLRTVIAADPTGKPQSLAAYLSAGSTFGAQAGKTDAKLRVRAGELLLPGATFVDAAVDLEVRDGRTRVSQLRLAADHGVTLDVEGEMPTLGTSERGVLRGSVSAGAVEGVRALAHLLAVPLDALPTADGLAALAPLRVAGSVAYAIDAASRIDVTLDGDAAGTRVVGKARFDRGLADWQAAPVDAAVTLTGPRAVALAQHLGGRTTAAAAQIAVSESASVVLHVGGTARHGLIADASLVDADRQVAFRGRITPGTSQGLILNGDLHVAGAGGDTVLSLLTGQRLALPPVPIEGRARVETADARIRLESIVATVAGTSVRGLIGIDTTDGAITGRLQTADLPVMSLVQPLLTARAASMPASGSSVWPAAAFDDKALADTAVDVVIEAGRLTLPAGVGIDTATFQLALRPGRVEVRDLEGRAAGGLWTGAGRIDVAKDGGALTLALRVKDLRTAGLKASATTAPAIDTALSGAVTFTGRGATLQEMVAAASGRGSVIATDARWTVLAPGDVVAALHASLKTDPWVPAFRQQLAATPTKRTVSTTARTLELEVRNGILSMAPVTLESPDGKTAASATVGLSTLTLASALRIEPLGDVLPQPPSWSATITAGSRTPASKSMPPLPPIVATWSAPLGALDRARTDYASDAFEREVAVRKVERDLEELERLRRLDEDRAKDEAERRKALEQGALPAGGTAITSPVPAQAEPPSTQAATTTVDAPGPVDPTLRPLRPPSPIPAASSAPAPAPKPAPAYRPLSADEQRAIFNR